MKLSFAAFAVSLFVGAGAMKAPVTERGLREIGDKRRLEQSFFQAMHDDPKLHMAKRKQREQQRKRQLMDKLMEHAVPRELANSNGNSNANSGEYTMEDSYEWMNPVYQQMVEDGVFDLTARAFKYSGCAAIKSFDASRAQENGNPMVVDTYAVFRLCPEDSCNKYSLTGCGKNYGEYVVSMKTYLEFMLEFYEDHYGAYCEYCYPCDYDYQVMKHSTQGQCYENLNKQDYQYKQQLQQQAWQDYYEKNYGDMSQYDQQQQQQQAYNDYAQQQQNQYNQGNANGYAYNNVGNYNSGSYNNGGNRKLDGSNYNYQSGSSSGSSSYNSNGKYLHSSPFLFL
jgi:hypothetical protein